MSKTHLNAYYTEVSHAIDRAAQAVAEVEKRQRELADRADATGLDPEVHAAIQHTLDSLADTRTAVETFVNRLGEDEVDAAPTDTGTTPEAGDEQFEEPERSNKKNRFGR